MFDPGTFLTSDPASEARPRGLRGAAQEGVCSAWWGGTAPANRGVTSSQKAGLRYERRVLDVLSAIYEKAFTPSPMIVYEQHGERRRAIPDGVLRIDESVVIVEVKLAHTAGAWTQLMDLYVPLISMIEPRAHLRPVEVCRSYDPAVVLPGSHELIESLHTSRASCARRDRMEVLRWKI